MRYANEQRLRRTMPMNKILISSIFFCILPAAHGQNQLVEAQDLPDAKGKDVVQKVCSVCHEPTAVGRFRKSKEGWQMVIDDMVTRGADASDQEFDTVIDYLAKCFGPLVNVNKSTADELVKQLEISAKEAGAIVEYRQSNGDFKQLADLKKVSSLDFSKIEPLKYRITF
jgi:competence protein ComEA